MEKFFLCRFLTCDKLNVVYKKHVRFSVFVSELGLCARSDAFYHLICKLIALDIDYRNVRIIFRKLVYNSIKKVSFSESRGSVNKEGVIFAGIISCYRDTSRMCELI